MNRISFLCFLTSYVILNCMGKLESVINNRVVLRSASTVQVIAVRSTHTAGGQHVASIYICEEKTSSNPFTGKARIECRSNFDNLRAVYLCIILLIHFVNLCQNSDTLTYV
jgi:hypothetical protein